MRAQGLPNDVSLTGAEGQQLDLPTVHDRTHTHGERAVRDEAQLAEKDRVIATGNLIEVDATRPGIQRGRRFIETDVPRATDAQDLQINPAGGADGGFVVGASHRGVGADTRRYVGIFTRDVDEAKKVLLHEITVGLGMVTREAFVFVEIEGHDVPEAEACFAMQPDQLRVQGQGGRTRRQA